MTDSSPTTCAMHSFIFGVLMNNLLQKIPEAASLVLREKTGQEMAGFTFEGCEIECLHYGSRYSDINNH